MTVIRADEIAQYGWKTLADLLRTVTGVYTAYDRGYTYVGVRGFLQSGDYNARVLLLIDGHRINDNIFDSGLIGTEFPLDLSLIDRVEFLRGPGSSLYGTNAELGVINVITRHPERGASVRLATDAASFAGRTGEISGSLHARHSTLLTSASLFRSNGAAHLYFPEYSSADTGDGIAHNLDGDRYDHAFSVFRSGPLRIEGLFSKRTKLIPNASYGTTFADPRNRESDTRAYLDASYSTDLGVKTQLDLRTYYDAYRYWGSFPYASDGQSTVQINDARADWVGFEAVIGQMVGKHRLIGGLSLENSFRLNQQNYYEGQAPFLDDNRRKTLTAAFGEAELNLHPKMTLNLGGRLDHYNSFDPQFSPRIAMMYLPTGRTSVKYIFSKAFRAPDPYDQFYVDEIDITATAKNLVPEHSRSSNLIVDHAFSKWFRVSGGPFETSLNKVIREQVDPIDGSTHFVNGQRDKSYGIETEGEIRRDSGVSARSSITWINAKDGNTQHRLMNSPSTLFKFNGALPITRLASFGVESLYSGSQTNYAKTPVSSSVLTNVTLSTRSIRDWQISATCYNLLDRKWYTPTGPEVASPATAQDGRTFRFRIEYRRSFERRWSGQ